MEAPVQASEPSPEKPSTAQRLRQELRALVVAAAASFAALSILSDEIATNSNLGGPVGHALASGMVYYFGHLAIAIALGMGWLAVALWRGVAARRTARIAAGAALMFLVLECVAAMAGGPAWGGVVGAAVSGFFGAYVSIGGTLLLLVLGALFALALAFELAPTELAHRTRRALARPKRAPEASDAQDDAGETSAIVLEHEVDAEAADITDESPVWSQPASRGASEPIELPASSAPPPAARRVRRAAKLPSHALLDRSPLSESVLDRTALEESARVLEQKLDDFGVTGRVVGVQPGPVISMYKFEPASGVKVSQVLNLADDLSLALKAPSIRIQAPVPGEAVIGIEVPNRKREKIYLREILEAPEFAASGGHLTIALGKTISGRPAAADLARMPHLLIAGATGAGKSVALHAMIASIVFNATAEDVRFILIDPKMLELSVYEGIPHLLVPVVVDPDKATAALLWATQEMERRYRLMRELGVRNIDGYNQALEKASQPGAAPFLRWPGHADSGDSDRPPLEHRKLPKIVIVIDELADLMLSEGKNVERDITRLAQKARASGIHLILATQRPSVDIITGLIKANMPARISFQVASRVDSRTILDAIGAERLLGEGDMLFMPPGTAKLQRLHGPFVSESEIRKVTDFLRAQGAPDYQMEILETKRFESGGADASTERDEMYDEAVRIVSETNQASISMIQRRLRIGYNRAARIVEQMEREGLVSPSDGLRPREVRNLRVVR
jgi:S-DNA-T family DNA segregation ATPase FtsK/SpoIIIE